MLLNYCLKLPTCFGKKRCSLAAASCVLSAAALLLLRVSCVSREVARMPRGNKRRLLDPEDEKEGAGFSS